MVFQFFNYLVKGGIVMFPLGLCSILALAIIMERLWSLRRDRIFPPRFLDEIKVMLAENRISEALEFCQKTWNPFSRILEAGILKHQRPRAEIKEAMENAGRQELPFIEKYLDALATIVGIAPFLGLLGTVSGMIHSFEVITSMGVGDPHTLASGISEALIATASGLSVAIPTQVFHGYFHQKTTTFVLAMEKSSNEVLEILSEDKNKALNGHTVDTWEIR
jgi:biopolymer transport protein ExbB